MFVGMPDAAFRHGSAPIFPKDPAPMTPQDSVPRLHGGYSCLRPQTYDEHDFDQYPILSYCLGFGEFCPIDAVTGIPTPTPTPTATWVLLCGALGGEVALVAVDEGEGVRRAAADEDDSFDNVDDRERDDTAELAVKEASVMEELVREAGIVVSGITGAVPRANTRDEFEQHVESSSP
ncbi:hypothetical protein BDR22DRAFT_977388 [Usnea florida]